jgi:hypothetical protein
MGPYLKQMTQKARVELPFQGKRDIPGFLK